ncbi:MAG TPA: hypothetical protein VF400_13890 [Anaeromyxobacteraceae bacterium]
MYKALAVLRTVFLVFILGYTIRATPMVTSVARTFDEEYARCSSALNLVVRGAWFAVAWIAFETLVGWVLVRSRSRSRSTSAPGPGSGPRPGSSPPGT